MASLAGRGNDAAIDILSPFKSADTRDAGLARMIHEGFYCNRRYAAATSLSAGGLATQLINTCCFNSQL